MSNYKVTFMVTVDVEGETEALAINDAMSNLANLIKHGNSDFRITGLARDINTGEYLVFEHS